MRALDGKVALITGAGRGFGLATAELFAEAGADIALNYRNSKKACEELANCVQRDGGKAQSFQADIANADQVKQLIDEVISTFGRIDILINNAGVMHLSPFVESSEESWREELEINIFGPLRVARAVLPHMIEQRYGKVVNLSSQLALIGSGGSAVYSGSKGFILTWTKSLAREVGQFNINVNAIGPGSIITDMNRDGVYGSKEAIEKKEAELPLRRLGSPRDVAECALFLSTDASNFLTGQMLGPNGGNVM